MKGSFSTCYHEHKRKINGKRDPSDGEERAGNSASHIFIKAILDAEAAVISSQLGLGHLSL
jgi:hypothetical protein